MDRAHRWPFGLLVGAVLLSACAGREPSTSVEAAGTAGEGSSVRYVALGDSYTIGTSVAEADRFPNQLAERVEQLELVGNPAVNGFTSLDLITEELPQLDAFQPEIVSVLIGVNDVVQGVSDSQYAGNVVVILEELLTRLPPQRILCIATPDYTVTPRGEAFGDPIQQSDAILRANAILREACEARQIRFVPEIFEISQGVRDDPSLVADDGLHPSGAQYGRWVDVIAPGVEGLLRD
ncbi:MAG TPA: SGNH/GDSL hydrolase family protein [Candidatus Limnocylindrales bacterium]|nr:SGNH/GDSL hydrolase family protein [Candidatus Limnocylindrales bacterium]